MIKKAALSIALASSLTLGLSTVYADSHAYQWIGGWEASQQMPYDSGISHDGFNNQTVRMIIHPHAVGKAVKLRFSNVYGTQPLQLDKVVIAQTATGAQTVPGTERIVTFEGKMKVIIPVGQELKSDAIPFEVKQNENLTVSVYTSTMTGPTSWHNLSRETSYVSTAGDHTIDNQVAAFPNTYINWFWLDGVDVLTQDNKPRVIVTLGDSITDGYASTVDANHRWGDYLEERLQEKYKNQSISVLNAGISGNKILRDSPIYGVKALDRFDRDVLSQTGVTDLVLLEGINDIGHLPHELDANKIITGIQQIVDRAHARGIRVYGATLTPFRGHTKNDYFTEEGEKTRESVNNWIRTSGAFDSVIDFDKAIQDPANPEQMLPAYDSGDFLHPNDAGYKAMADAIDLALFKNGSNDEHGINKQGKSQSNNNNDSKK